MTTDPTIMSILAGESYARLSGTGDPYKVVMMGTNDGFWRIFDFTFIDGRPFGEPEFQSAVPRAVISSSLARKIFSRTDVSGQAFLLDDVEYIVSGVVEDVSYITPAVVADLWVPYSCLPTVMETGNSEREASLGFLVGCILPARGVSEEEVAHELDEQIRLYNSTLRDGKIRLMNGLEAHGRHVVSQFAGGSIGSRGERGKRDEPGECPLFRILPADPALPAGPGYQPFGLERLPHAGPHCRVRRAQSFRGAQDGTVHADFDREYGADAARRIGRLAVLLPADPAFPESVAGSGSVCHDDGRGEYRPDSGDDAEPSGLRVCLFGLLGAQLPVVVDTGLACRTGEYNRCYKQLNGEMPCLNIYSN